MENEICILNEEFRSNFPRIRPNKNLRAPSAPRTLLGGISFVLKLEITLQGGIWRANGDL